MAHTKHGIIWGFDDYPNHVTVDSTEGNEGWSIAQTKREAEAEAALF